MARCCARCTPASRRPRCAALVQRWAAAACHCGLGGRGGGAGGGGVAGSGAGRNPGFQSGYYARSAAQYLRYAAHPGCRPAGRRPWGLPACGRASDTLIIDAGTALKFDLVTADGTYHGGSIAAGAGHAAAGAACLHGAAAAAGAAGGRCNDSARGRLHYREPVERRSEWHGGRNRGLTCSISAAISRIWAYCLRGAMPPFWRPGSRLVSL